MALAEVRLHIAGGEATLEAHGEFDVATVRTLADALREACAAGLNVRLDLAAVSFLDVCCLRDVLDARDRLARNGCCIRIVNAGWMARRLFELTHTADLLAHGTATDAGLAVRTYSSDEAERFECAAVDARLADRNAWASGFAARLPRMRGEMAELPVAVADVEEQTAAALDSRTLSVPDRAVELRPGAASARRVAAAEREMAQRHGAQPNR